jgi:hypothetical protein
VLILDDLWTDNFGQNTAKLGVRLQVLILNGLQAEKPNGAKLKNALDANPG